MLQQGELKSLTIFGIFFSCPLSSAALANQERWYKPPVRQVEEEEYYHEEEEEREGEEQDEEQQPPSKKANVQAAVTDKGSLPGSHPGNVRK